MAEKVIGVLIMLGSFQTATCLSSYSKFSTLEGSSQATKSLVASLTTLVNTLGEKSDRNVPRVRKFKFINCGAVLEGIRKDLVENEYLWSGDITPEIYDERCRFTDPTLSFEGLSTFESNLANLKPWIERFVPPGNRKVELKSIQLKDNRKVVEAEWRMVGDIQLPWRPRLDLEGRTRFILEGEGGRISSYDEAWAIAPSAALQQLVTPYTSTPSSEANRHLSSEAQPSFWPGRLQGLPPPQPKVVLRGGVPPVVILPGFGNDRVDYVEPLQQPEEVGFVAALKRRGAKDVRVSPVERSDWLKVLRGLLDVGFLQGDAQPDGEAFSWYLDLAKTTIESSFRDAQGARVLLIGHSAGGWLARALCDREGEAWARRHIRGIVSLGSPHLGPPPEMPDQTRGTVSNLNKRSPGAQLRRKDNRSGGDGDGVGEVFYVTVASSSIVGDAEAARGTPAKLAYDSYSMVCGNGDGISGDGVVPLVSAHLEDANAQITLNCFHSINKAGTALPTDDWYGAEGVVDEWLAPVASELRAQQLKELIPKFVLM